MRDGTELAREIQLTHWSTAGNLSNRFSGVQIPRDICTRVKQNLYSAKCSWIINMSYQTFCCVVSLSILRVVWYFGEPAGRVKIQTTSTNIQRYYKTKRLIRDLLSNTPNWSSWERISWIFIYRECVKEVCENVVLRHLNVNCFYHDFLTLTWRLCRQSNSSRAHYQLK